MAQFIRKQYRIRYDQRAIRFISSCPKEVRNKLKGTKYLYEVRVKFKGEYRFIYAYVGNEFIIFLSGFRKKQNKTPTREIELAKNRLKNY
ncbi:MAG: hypothetical protein US52_C0051G0013 [candidate division WS6 bacterium GW2011_GWA2_37_6]|uniref:Type II toxin-antitoxin system RelE/ParE family toxin n=1 Tax=candidate division WS6 bacterium GW2011_GWA2_37_6 TaxID=1619087 RepID=A0A0G0K201_9BACT|nr:MAG: hypothetical protein US52_C0051G0013 [candidate division WS6 bacterium GW2011_GWA2_37_6]